MFFSQDILFLTAIFSNNSHSYYHCSVYSSLQRTFASFYLNRESSSMDYFPLPSPHLSSSSFHSPRNPLVRGCKITAFFIYHQIFFEVFFFVNSSLTQWLSVFYSISSPCTPLRVSGLQRYSFFRIHQIYFLLFFSPSNSLSQTRFLHPFRTLPFPDPLSFVSGVQKYSFFLYYQIYLPSFFAFFYPCNDQPIYYRLYTPFFNPLLILYTDYCMVRFKQCIWLILSSPLLTPASLEPTLKRLQNIYPPCTLR
eukprot:TRINITY_DN5180_c0_g1_i3.p1 TRINITY_DN5180_c0_g1~~TRINITY_DN5180_c0_g1_i3.p1  ORF type:complete len:252 (+),score=-25.99 TRINITY_DN5180_c0_g1_i3:158-913(+)